MTTVAGFWRRTASASVPVAMDVQAALTELVPSVRRWIYRTIGPGPDFDDAVQDALVELATALPRFEGRAQLTTFAHPVVVRTAYRYLAKRRAQPIHGEVDRVSNGDDPERRAQHREQLERLHRVL